MRHSTTPSFRSDYEKLPRNIRELADKNFALLKENPQHPSLHFKKVDKYWSARVGIHYRALAIEAPDGFVWIAVVRHKRYDQIV
jgi:mRNA-degrading endonuclease RelE of RelBE toxin-antitoxin system